MRTVGVPLTHDAPAAAGHLGPVGAFVVTYRRPKSLEATLRGILAQTRRPDTVTVLNCDETGPLEPVLAAAFPEVEVIDLRANLGSAGGFKEALALGYRRGLAWIWLFDDDCVPHPDALGELLRVPAEMEDVEGEPIGILAPFQVSANAVYGVSVWRDRVVPLPQEQRRGTTPVAVDLAYWAGLLVGRRVIERIGYPRGEFFRCFGDYEYCLRARRAGFRVVAAPASRVDHDHGPHNVVVRFGRPSTRLPYPPSRSYYHARNAAFTTRFVVRSPRAALRHALRQVRLAAGDLVYADRKLARLRLRFRGLLDGFRGRLGRRVDL